MTTVFAIGDGDMGATALYLFSLWLIWCMRKLPAIRFLQSSFSPHWQRKD